MNINEMIKKQKGKWLITKKDKTKWVIDLDNMTFDNYKWYKATGTLESELTDIDEWLKYNQIKRLESEMK